MGALALYTQVHEDTEKSPMSAVFAPYVLNPSHDNPLRPGNPQQVPVGPCHLGDVFKTFSLTHWATELTRMLMLAAVLMILLYLSPPHSLLVSTTSFLKPS